MTKQISRATAALILSRSTYGGKIFSVTFTKKDGSTRKMTARRGAVMSAMSGRGANFSRAKKGLVCVYDMHRHGYRHIPVDRVKEIRIQGEHYIVTQ